MKNFMIGMHGKFDKQKFERDFKDSFYGIEMCQFTDETEINELNELSVNNNFKLGVHFPLRKNIYRFRDPMFLSLDREISEEAYQVFEKELDYLKDKNIEYILTHFPKPVLMNKKYDWSQWWFNYKEEHMDMNEYPFDLFEQNVSIMFERLSDLGNKYNKMIILENDAFCEYVYKTDLLTKNLEKYPKIKLCLDTGRLHFLEKTIPEFSAEEFIIKHAKYFFMLHLWNVKAGEKVEYPHYPVLPWQKSEDGWGDHDNYLRLISGINKDIKILFEHRSDLISDSELETCYNWVNSYFSD